VTRNPCSHPGDIKLLKAVDHPNLKHLNNMSKRLGCSMVPTDIVIKIITLSLEAVLLTKESQCMQNIRHWLPPKNQPYQWLQHLYKERSHQKLLV